MKTFAWFFGFAASFLGILNAARIGSLVRLKGLESEREYNDRIGLIESFVNGRAKVWVFLDTLMTGPNESFEVKRLKSYFFHVRARIENLEVIESTDWNPAVSGLTEQLENDPVLAEQMLKGPLAKESVDRLTNFSIHLDQICAAYGDHQIRTNPSVEVKIIGVWMNQGFHTSFLEELPDFSAMNPFQVDRFVFLEGLERSPQYNGLVGIITNLAPDRTEVLTFVNPSTPGPIDGSQAFRIMRLHDKNLRLITNSDWEILPRNARTVELSDSAFNYVMIRYTAAQKAELSRIGNWITSACQGSSVEALKANGNGLKVRLLGAWINMKYSSSGMSFVNADLSRDIRAIVSELWHGIGIW